MVETTTKRISLEVTSPAAKLTGLTQASRALTSLNERLLKTNTLIDALSGGTGIGRLGSAAESSASRATAAIARITASAQTANAAMNRIGLGGGTGGGNGQRPDRWLNRGTHGWTPQGFAQNTLTVGAWMGAASVWFKGMELAEHSVSRMMELQKQTAVLRQTFRGVGGSASELADDVLKLAAAEGRGTEEAMKASIHWTRLGLDRRQAAEATRVSLIAANVAEMTAEEATEKLASVMATYNLQASELNGTLGMLARTSQTYRVTTNDLLNGLARVSNIAKQSGMSLAELQGIMGAMVQKTGLSGERVANALQIFLNRVNNPGVQEFFERRYNTHLAGNAADFQKIYAIYQKVSADEQREIRLRVGTPRQSNVFSAFMETYPQMTTAAISSLTNLNAAEEENIKVTNTASAAVERLKASWDRLINSPSANRQIAGGLNVVSGSLAAIDNILGGSSGEAPTPTYFNPEGANWKGLLTEGMLASARITGIPGTLKLLAPKQYAMLDNYIKENLGITKTPTAEGDIFQSHMNDIIAHSRAAEGYGLSVEMAKRNGDKTGEADSVTKRKEQLAIAKQLTDEEIKRLNVVLAAEKNQDKRKIIEREILEAKHGAVALDYQELDLIDRTEMKVEQMTRIMTAQKLLAQDIGTTLKNISLPKWVEESVSTSGQLAMTRQMLSIGEKKQAGAGENADLWESTLDALRKQALNLEMRQRYLESPVAGFYQREQSNLGVASKMAGFEIEGHGVGLSEGEKLLDKRKWLAQEQSRFGDVDKMNEAQLARAAAITNSLKETELSLQERILKIDKERHQVMIETQREFQKSLITAGPGELLRKMATSSLMKGGKISAGEFFSLSGEMRGDAYNLMGGEGMARLNQERKALSGQGRSVSSVQQSVWSGESFAAKIGVALEHRLSVGADAAAKVANHMSAAAASALAIENALANAARSVGAPPAVAPSAAPVPQAIGTHSTVTDYSGNHGWQPNAAQRAALAFAGVQ